MSQRSLALLIFFFTSVLGLQAQWTPTELDGLLLWVRADSGVVVDGTNKVQQWQDLSGQENDLSEIAPNYQPLLVSDVLNGHAGIQFDGSNDNLEFDELTTIRSVFWVLRESEEATYNYRSLLGDNDSYHFLRGENGLVWNAQFTDEAIQNGSTRIGFEEIDGVNSTFPQGFQVVSLRTTAPVTASRFNRDRFYIDRAWKGEILELLIFDVELDSAQTVQVEQYLANYYTEPLWVGEDITIPDNFCDTTLSVPSSFQVIQWSTGATSQEIAVNQSGTYWVEAADAFGRVQVDSVVVTFPGTLDFPAELTVCEGELAIFDTGLNDVDYSFLWSTGDETPQITVNTAQVVSVSIQDALGCSVTLSPTEVVIDHFTSEASLQPGDELCAGNSVFLDPQGAVVESFSWFDGSEEPEYVVQESATVALTAINSNGCVFEGSLDVTVVGAAPELEWLPQEPWCAGAPHTLEADVLNGQNVVEWTWTVNGTAFTGNPVQLDAQLAGTVSVELEAVTDAGCSTVEQTDLEVYALPELLLSHDLLCAGAPMTLWVSNETPGVEIEEIEWVLAGQAQQGDTAEFMGIEPGFWSADLITTTAAGCVSMMTAFVEVQPAPEVGFSAQGQCLGQLTVFDAEIVTNGAGNASNYNWDFGDNTSSSLPSPAHLYAAPGAYEVSLLVYTSNGCSDSAAAQVSIVPLPEADFALGNACMFQPFQLEDLSVSDQDPIVSWTWEVENEGEFSEQNPVVYFGNEGFHEVVLEVETALGCTDVKHAQIPVFVVPEPAFEMDPPIGSAPLEVQFINLTEGASSFFWDFGNGLSAEESAPEVTYDTDGLYTIELTASNQYGCSATVEIPYLVDEPVLDLEVIAVQPIATANGLLVRATLVNAGNFGVEQAAMQLTLPNDAPVTEVYTTFWAPGEVVEYEWNVLLNPQITDHYVCAHSFAESTLTSERTPENNGKCVSLSSGQLLLADVFPNPASHNLYLRVISPAASDLEVQLVNAHGQKLIHDQYAVQTGFNQLQVDVSQLGAGIYTLKVFNGYEEVVRQVVLLR